jgi:hypothetical protein
MTRFLVPFSIVGCVAIAFALYAWGGMGPAEQELVALAHVPFAIAMQAPGTDPVHVARIDAGPAHIVTH